MAVKYIPFFPEPIQGQALLDNFNRTLRYKGNFDVKNNLQRGMPHITKWRHRKPLAAMPTPRIWLFVASALVRAPI